MFRTLGILLLVAIFCIVVALAYFNRTPVDIDYLFGSAKLALALLLLVVFAFAVALTALLCSARMLGQHREIRHLRKQLKTVESELRSLRALPAGDR
ncbi:MAG TPA: lipopolysaccharide assembly protein LapA domain-containing protein [Nevskiaceae bacterium]